MNALVEFWTRLPAGVRTAVKTVATIALNGGAAALSFITIDPAHFNLHELRHVGGIFAVGAIVAVINWLRQQPWKPVDPNVVDLSKRTVGV